VMATLREKAAAGRTYAAEKIYSPWSRILGAVLPRGSTQIFMLRGTATDALWHRVMVPETTGRSYTAQLRIVNFDAANTLDVCFNKQPSDDYYETIPANDMRHYRLGRNGLTIWIRASAAPTDWNCVLESY